MIDTQYRNVELSSRRNIPCEIDTMKGIVDRLPDLDRLRVQEIYCNSVMGADYVVTLVSGRCTPSVVVALSKIDRNGLIIVDRPNGIELDLGPSFDEVLLSA